MNLKRVKLISVIGVFLLMVLFHFVYDFLPNDITAIFFPVNESIWEHMKLLFTSFLGYGIIEYGFFHFCKIRHSNFLITTLGSTLFSIPLYLLCFLPLYYRFGYSMPLVFGTLIFTIIITEWLSFLVMKKTKPLSFLRVIAVLGIIVCYIGFGYLTYQPFKTPLFFDTQEEKYGLNLYRV